ncbi:heme oxygenase (staphylobilin-producing) [Scopulibacillus darangshiensis]|uniref:Heme oxygenase (Staphylobilin-producing) n=1 Tax=Scopulibacillus darangshiensis TaxID=442528 RepID=A0A4R2P7M3_9BACL|nr:antibiotic biosynthesis monooxygenase [Scopulibacillus darangshiensis]TCP30903.1 heme oxygenase (staphylobilin-producing) [Scopulibacillus darangshiensis]
MYVVVNTITTEDPEKIAERFRMSAPQLKECNGFVNMELWKADNKIEAISRWETKEDFEAYVNSDMFHQHHSHSRKAEKQTSQTQNSQASYYEGEVIA